jgi:hypothetical protein
MRYDPKSPYSFINLWTEGIYMLLVKDAEPIAVPDIQGQNRIIMDERFGKDHISTAKLRYSHNITKRPGTMRILPIVRNSTRGALIFVPSIPKMCDALLSQIERRKVTMHLDNRRRKPSILPAYNVYNLIRYLYLEWPSHRELLLPLLGERSQAAMEQRLDKYVRKPSQRALMERIQALGYKLPVKLSQEN